MAEMKNITKKYTNGEMTVVWQPGLCIHSMNCFKGLGQVFDPNKRPWVNATGATTQQIVEQIKKCPSGALSFEMNDQQGEEVKTQEIIVEPSTNGPLLIYGNLKVKGSDGAFTQKSKVTAFCRCGASSNKPFCDGTHRKVDFKG